MDTINFMITTSFVELGDRAYELVSKERNVDETVRYLEKLAERAVRFAAYMEARHEGQSHERAVKKQNTAARKVRKSLGYAVTHDINF